MVHGMRLIRYREIMHRDDEECGAGVYEWAGREGGTWAYSGETRCVHVNEKLTPSSWRDESENKNKKRCGGGGGAKNVHNTRQHEGGGCDVCREREAGQCNFVLRNFSCIARVMARPSLYKSQAKGRNYRVSQRGTSRDETIRIHTGDAYEEDRWNDYYIESAPPHNPGSPNDNGVPQNRLAVCSLSSFSRDHEYDVRLLPGERSVRSTRVRSH